MTNAIDEPRQERLIEPHAEPLESLDALAAECLPALTARLSETCFWADTFGRWNIGDYRFIAVEFYPSEDARLLGAFTRGGASRKITC